MAVCQYFLRGACKFGNTCRNEHVRPQTTFGNQTWTASQPLDVPFTTDTLRSDIMPQKDKPLWPLSSYGPAKYEPTLITNQDESPEELRFRALMAVRSGSINEYLRYESEKIAAAERIYANVRANIASAYEEAVKRSKIGGVAAAQGKSNPLATSGARSSTSAFGQPSAFGSALGSTAPASVFGKPTFGQPAFGQSAFGQTTTTSAFGQPQPTSVFGQSQLQPTTAFGQSKPQTASAFGQTQHQASSVFGSTQPPAPSVFGQAQPSATSTFGQSQPQTTSAFGQTQQPQSTSAFGQSQPLATPAFAQTQTQTTSTFGSSQPQTTSAFGQAQAPAQSAFSQTQVPAFGQMSQPQSSIIKPAIGAFGSFSSGPSAFGSGGTSGGFSAFSGKFSAFGPGSSTENPAPSGSATSQSPQTHSQPSAFGSNTSTFGAAPSAFTSFGQQSKPQSTFASPFNPGSTGGSVFAAGSTVSSPFAPVPPASQPARSVFGAPTQSTTFGSQTAQPSKPPAGPPDFVNISSPYKPGLNPYDSLLPSNYKEMLPPEALMAFQAKKFEWGKVPEWIPPLDLR